MKILLTGAGGFLGSSLALRLAREGHDVSLLVRPQSSLARLAGEHFETGVYSSDVDIRKFVQRIRPEVLIHTACSYGRQGESVLTLSDANLRFGLAMLQALIEGDAARCLFINTGTALPAATSVYALSKHQFADWGRVLAIAHPRRLRFVNVELQHMYGPGDAESKFTTHVLHACHANVPELALTAGEQRRDFIYIDDVLDAYQTLLRRSDSLSATAEVPIGSGVAPTIREFVETVHRLCTSRTHLAFGAVPYRPGEAMLCRADLGPMADLGWAPRWTLEAGLAKTIELEF